MGFRYSSNYLEWQFVALVKKIEFKIFIDFF